MTEGNTTTTPGASAAPAPKARGVKRDTDTSLGWVERDHPQLATWRVLAVEWLKGEEKGVGQKLNALVAFFERYLVQQGLPLDPAVFLARSTVLPDFCSAASAELKLGIVRISAIVDACFRLIVDGESVLPRWRWGDAQELV